MLPNTEAALRLSSQLLLVLNTLTLLNMHKLLLFQRIADCWSFCIVQTTNDICLAPIATIPTFISGNALVILDEKIGSLSRRTMFVYLRGHHIFA